MIRNKHSRLFSKLPMVVAIGLASLAAQQVSAHAFIKEPPSRAAMCNSGANKDCGGVQYEPQSVEYSPAVNYHFPDANKGCLEDFTKCGPAEGKIAAGGMQRFGELNEQTAIRWEKTTIQPGMNTFKWYYKQAHKVAYYQFYITKKDWNPNQPLTRDSFELEPLLTQPGDGTMPKTNDITEHQVNIPADRSGYHVVLATWRIGDTDATFYQVVDVDIDGEEVAPSPWNNLGAVQPKALEIGDKVITRVFNASGELQDKQVSLTIASQDQGQADNWPKMLAEKVNAASLGYLMGELNKDGEIVPSFGKNSVYVAKGSDITGFELQQELVNQPIELNVTGMQPSYTLKDGKVDLHFNAIAKGSDFTIKATVFNAKNESIAQEVAKPGDNTPHFGIKLTGIEAGKFDLVVVATPKKGEPKQETVSFKVQAESDGSYDFVFPEGIKGYKAGTTVLQPKDGNTYECKPGQVAGWCVQWSPTATGFEPGVGSNWQDAWIRK